MTTRRKKNLAIGGFFLWVICLGVVPEMVMGWMGIAATMLFGWVPFLIHAVPQIRVRWSPIGSTAVYIVLLLSGSHYFLRWLYREMRGSAVPSNWNWRWTVGAFLIIVLMFTSGMAAIGAAHQTAWLVHSPVPLLKQSGGRETANRVKCGSNLRQIALALTMHANEHGGKYPDDFAELFGDGFDLYPSALVCPSTNDEPAIGATTQAVIADFATPHHCSYVYLGKGLSQPLSSDRVMALESLVNHQGEGMNVLFGDMHVEWLDKAQADTLLAKLAIPGGTTRESHLK